ncbi:unnamed protein product [Blepharisma stoltei]|uniref:Uncharacterized protein n=1 Tax=Blepharisma stoltei TaxID=1481888 RepID=A0AAU9IMH7_9CILI|nr:unnamed protein product [Blepharisma stoltei]
MDILIKFHIDKIKEIIVSNLSDSISIKSYTIASSQIANGKVKMSTHNEWWTYFQSFYDFFEVLVLKLDEVSQNSETYSSLAQSNLGATEVINSPLTNKTSQDLLNVVIDTNIIKALVQKLRSDIEKERSIVLIFIKFIYRKMPSIQTIILKQIEYSIYC